jgi:hypothetical protein
MLPETLGSFVLYLYTLKKIKSTDSFRVKYEAVKEWGSDAGVPGQLHASTA